MMHSRNPNHPAKGSTTKVAPIRTKKAIANIKNRLKPRDRCLFTLDINTAFRAGELLSIRYSQVCGMQAGASPELKQSKTDKNRTVTVNRTAAKAIQDYLRPIRPRRSGF